MAIAYVKLLSIKEVGYIIACGSLKDMGLPNADILIFVPVFGDGLAPNEFAVALYPPKK